MVLYNSGIDLRVTGFSTLLSVFATLVLGKACTNFVVKSKRFEQMSSAWWQMKALLKLFTTVTDFLMLLSLICTGNIQIKPPEFQKRKSMILTLKIKVNHFTLSAVKSKRIELQRSAWWH